MTVFKAPVRLYNFSDGRLIEISEEKLAFARRDVAELTPLGLDVTWTNNFEAMIDAFVALPSDEIELGEQEEATDEKNQEAEDLREMLRSLRSAASRAFGEDTPNYKKFGLKGLDKFSDSELLRRGFVAKAVANTYVAELTPKGFDATAISALGTQIEEFVVSLQNKALEVGSRDTAQETRVLTGNALYRALEQDLCEAAKTYWQPRSAAKFNDYIIYHTEHTQVDNGTVPANSILRPAVTVNSPSDFIQFSIPAGGQTLKIYCAEHEEDGPTPSAVTVVNGSGWSGRADDIGWTSVNRLLLIANETVSDSAFEVRVS